MRFFIIFCLLATLLVPTAACSRTELIEAVSKHYASQHPGLDSYRVDLKTNKLDEMLARMTGNMPKDIPRPEAPDLMKFWNRKSGIYIRSKTVTAFPYMEQMINRFSQRFAIELGSLFLPIDKTEIRQALLKKASVKSAEAQIADSTIYHFDIEFDEPTDLDGAFYGADLDLPQREIEKLALDIDPDQLILIHIDIAAREQSPLSVEIRHLDAEGNMLPQEVSITSPDGSIDEQLTTEFTKVENYYLPSKQARNIHRPGLDEQLVVEFYNYVLNPE
ncbi:MAG: hypothetical protein C0623_10365 [Desulfuromonas sp.]|nr:MAG: hypothetical protein C0623_10365 [Desulfuromonas sp.]